MDNAALVAALKAAAPGDVIDATSIAAPITLSNLTINGPVTVKLGAIGVPANGKGVQLSNVKAKDPLAGPLILDGYTIASGDGSQLGLGLSIRSCAGIVAQNGRVSGLQHGVYHDNSDRVSFLWCEFDDIGTDAFRGGGSNYVTVDHCYFHDFHRKDGEHPDAIQFWTTNTTRSTIGHRITNNVFERAGGTQAQAIFFGNEWKMPYSDVVIENNVALGMMPNGISIDYPRGCCSIKNNVCLGYTDMASKIRVLDAYVAPSADAATGLVPAPAVTITIAGNQTSHYVFDAQKDAAGVAIPSATRDRAIAFDHAPVAPQLVVDANGVLADPGAPERIIRAMGLADVAKLPPLPAPAAAAPPPTLEEQLAALQAQYDAAVAADVAEDAAYEARIADLSAQLDTATHALGDAGSAAKAKDAALAEAQADLAALKAKITNAQAALG